MKLTRGQATVLVAATLPMAAAGIAGAIASYFNFTAVLASRSNAASLVLAGEASTVICALVALSVTLMGQHTPAPVRAGLWLIPMTASAAGGFVAPDANTRVVMILSPLAMTAAGEGVTLVARRVVAHGTGVDIEQQRRSGLLLWHANRAANGRGLGRRLSQAAVWRLTKSFAATDAQLSVQLGEIQRFRIQQGADANLAAVLAGPERPSAALPPAPRPVAPVLSLRVDGGPVKPVPWGDPIENLAAAMEQNYPMVEPGSLDAHFAEVAEVLAEADTAVRADPSVKLMTTAEVAALKGVAPGTVRSWAHRGKLTRHMVDGVPMYHPADVAELD